MNKSVQVEDANFHHLVMDIAWFGLALAATSRFIQFYAIRMGATPIELGWLTSLPAIVLFMATGMSVWWRKHYPNSIKAVWLPSIGYRFIFLLPAFAPMFPEEWRPTWIVVSAVLPALPQGISNVIFLPMMRECVDADHLTPLFTRRAFAMNLTITLGAIIFGFLLEIVPYPLNYQIMFVSAFIFSIISQWHLGKLHPLQNKMEMPVSKQTTDPKSPPSSLIEIIRNPHFQSVALITLVSHIAFFSIFAVIPLRLERDFGAAEGFMALFGIVELLSGAIATIFVGKYAKKVGNRNMIAYGLFGSAIGGLTLAIAPTLFITLLGAAITGASWTCVTICVLGFFAERTGTNDIYSSMLFHQMIFLAIAIGPLLGSSLANSGVPTVTVLMGGAMLRVLAGIITLLGMSIFIGKRVLPVHQIK